MRAVIQRVTGASVTVADEIVGRIEHGYVVLLGVAHDDSEQDADYLAEKTAGLRVFSDTEGKMNLSVIDIAGSALVISQFTLLGDVRRGKRPSFSDAAPPEEAERLYSVYCSRLKSLGVPIQTGRFRADMQVALVNDGPVTILLDSKKLF